MKKRLLNTLLLLTLLVCALQLDVFAAHKCPECEDLIDGDLYCHSCYRCENCVEVCPVCETCTECSGANLCSGCNTCDNCTAVCETCGLCEDCSGSEICDSCTGEMGEVICLNCAIDNGYHCPECGECHFEAGDWCDECGRCYNCVDECPGCTDAMGHSVCVECGIDAGNHCPECGNCYFEVGDWCDICDRCYDCVDKCAGCSYAMGCSVCVECGADAGYHCPGCESCYFDVGDWCDRCGLCYYCADKCEGCSSEYGESICVDCAIAEGWHCPDCGGCYAEIGEYCSECGKCSNCAEICTECVADGICNECAVDLGLHCGGCYACSEAVTICESCGEACSGCADDFCEYCDLCNECTVTCPDCDHCSECAKICPECGECCSECDNFCDDCGLCEDCCKTNAEGAGCDCDEWVCVENSEWDEHMNSVHSEAGTHTATASARWSFDNNYHWHECRYCSKEEHYTAKASHTYDKNGKCTVCGYQKDAKIQIYRQPQDVKGVYVSDANSDYSHNTINFEVQAVGESKLTYKWYYAYYSSQGKLMQYYLDPKGDNPDTVDYEGPEVTVIVPTDACYITTYYFCVITDEAGNTVTTNMAEVSARHSYKYVDSYDADGHTLLCVGESCEASPVTKDHVDDNDDYTCDVCGYKLEHSLKQIDISYDDVYMAFQAGEKVSDLSERLENAYSISMDTSHASIVNDTGATKLYVSTTGKWADITEASGSATVNASSMYAVLLSITCTMKDDTVLPSVSDIAKGDIICLNGVPLKYDDEYYIKSGSYQKTASQNGQTVYRFSIYVKMVPSAEKFYKIVVQDGYAYSLISQKNIEEAKAGDTIYLAVEESGHALDKTYDFSYWECTKGNVTIKNDRNMYKASFVMPGCDVEFKAVYVANTSGGDTDPGASDVSVKLNKNTLTLTVGETETLVATVLSDDAESESLIWESSNESVAKVDPAGKVTALKNGVATITVTVGGQKDACTVTVSCDHDFIEKADKQYIVSEATCKSPAIYYKSCSKCGERGTATFTYGDKNPENHIASSKWEQDDTEHWKVCTVVDCGAILEKAAHTASDWIIDQAATESREGSKHKACTVCGKVLETAKIEKGASNSDTSSSRGGNVFLWIVIAVAVIACGVIAAIALVRKKKSSSQSN